VNPELVEAVEDERRLPPQIRADRVAAPVLSSRFSSGGQAMNAPSDEYAFESPATKMTWS
jgi:hypothetical protein